MDDTTFNDLMDHIDRYAQWWTQWLGLSHWEWRFYYQRERSQDCRLGGQTHACISAEADRMQFDVTFFLPSIADYLANEDDNEEARRERLLERMVVHELCHALVAEMRPLGPDAQRSDEEWESREERTVAQMTLAFMWIADNGMDRPRALDRRKRERREARARKHAKKARKNEVAA